MMSIPIATPAESAARLVLEQWPGLRWHSLERSDLPAVMEMLRQVEECDHASERSSLADLEEYFDSPRSHPEWHDLVARDADGVVVALAQSRPRSGDDPECDVLLYGAVTPSWRGRGLGLAIMRWEIEHAQSWAWHQEQPARPLVLSTYVEEAAVSHARLAQRLGLPVVRYFVEMECPLEPSEPEKQSEPGEVAGISITRWDNARSDEVRLVSNESFQDHWGSTPKDEERWREVTVGSHAFRPEWSLVALDADQVVGFVLNGAWQQDWEATGVTSGYTDRLGVLRSHRRRGIAKALLQRSMQLFAADGMQLAEIGVDTQNPSGAMGLYQSLGYRVTQQNQLHRVRLDVPDNESDALEPVG